MDPWVKPSTYGAMVVAAASLPVSAQTVGEEQAAIRATLLKWSADFNAGDAAAACGLFAADLRYDYRGAPERNARDMCDLLHRSLADKTRRFRYSPDIKEIIVSDSLAVVRVVWTLTVTPVNGAAKAEVSKEYGLDVFAKQADGSWQITRFLAYDVP